MLRQVLDIIDDKAIDSIGKGLEGDKKELLKGCFYSSLEGVIEGLTIVGGVVSAVVAYSAIKVISEKGS